jgi:hypothetical protein
MGYINNKLDSLDYYQLSHLLTTLRRDKQSFFVCMMETPKHLTSLISKVIEEIEKRADLIPSEKVMNDLNFKYKLVENE